MIQTAVSGAENYVEAGETENEVMQDTADYIDSVVASIKGSSSSDSGDSGSSGETISTETSYVGCYADIDGDNEVDGIIYADLLVDPQYSQWTDSNGTYSWTKIDSASVKTYTISEDTVTDDFGDRKVITASGTGTSRFYVMALDDVDSSKHYWYCNAYGNMSDYADTTSGDFGKGYANTGAMITKWNGGATTGYGEGITDGSYPDMWGLDAVQTGYTNGWFVPSRAEWSAFGAELEITSNNYGDYNLSDYYWSSSQYYAYRAYTAHFSYGNIRFAYVDGNYSVRLSTTF